METISMSMGERKRLEVFSRVKAQEMTLVEAGELLNVSYRQTKRIWSRYQEEGDRGLVHRARGRPSNRQAPAGVKDQALELFREHYADYSPTLAAECLAKEHDLEVNAPTLRRWLLAAGLWERRRKRKERRRRRPRRRHLGEMIQMDGSHHDWFEGRRASSREDKQYAGWANLMVMIDDATGRIFAQFYENESWHSAADIFQQYTGIYGLPRELYVDRHSIYRAERDPSLEELLADQEPVTQFGRAMQELDVRLIKARSAQAKGRVERMNRTLQDRLVKALRRQGISELPAANRYLRETFLAEFNGQFVKLAAESSDWHRPLDAETNLPHILSRQESRVVQNDWTIQWNKQVLQLTKATWELVDARDEITVCQYIDDSVHLFAGERELAWSVSRSSEPAPKVSKADKPRGPTGSSQGRKPAKNHPWR